MAKSSYTLMKRHLVQEDLLEIIEGRNILYRWRTNVCCLGWWWGAVVRIEITKEEDLAG